jgi:hypothetical protein
MNTQSTFVSLLLVGSCCVVFGLATSADAQELSAPNTWQLDRYPDPMHKGGVISAAVQSSAAEGGASMTALVRCWSATQDLDVRFVLSKDQPITSDEVRWHFDSGPDKGARWRRSPDRNALVVPEPLEKEIVRSIRTAKQLTLAIVTDRELTFHITLVGAARPIAVVLADCGR